MVQAILNVFAIIALVLVGGFIIYALAELILSADGKRGTLFFRNRKNTDRDNEILLEYNKNIDTNDSFYVQNENNKDLMLDFDKQYEQVNEAQENTTNVNMLKADEEQKLLEAKRLAEQKEEEPEAKQEEPEVYEDFVYINKENPEKQEEKEEEPVDVETVEEDLEEDDDDQSIEEILNSIQERNKNARNRFLADLDDDTEFEDEDEDYRLVDEINKEVVSPKEEVEEVVEETVVEDEAKNEEIEKLNAIISELNAKIEAERAKNEEMAQQAKAMEEERESLKKALEETQTAETEEITEDTLNMYNAKLDELLERQKQNEKDLRLNKKEYLPLLRIEKTLESDKAKLRRKEAIVAKKKMVLFGVNNYVADPEKEKKLLEDEDLLEGLKLSVAHCEEVMANNKDRYPVLKHANEILIRNANEIQADIDEVKAKIEHAKEVLSNKDTSNGTQSE